MGYKDGEPIIGSNNRSESTPAGWHFPSTEFTLAELNPKSVRFVGTPSPHCRPTLLVQHFHSNGDQASWRVSYRAEWAPCCEISIVVIMTTNELRCAFTEAKSNYGSDWVFQRSDDCLSIPTHDHGVNILLTAEICEAIEKFLAQNAKSPAVSQGE
ncbi:MAG: hypothetical protein WC553_00960 [Patescibacteria group bacterium]|jgi:hypothetical protein